GVNEVGAVVADEPGGLLNNRVVGLDAALEQSEAGQRRVADGMAAVAADPRAARRLLAADKRHALVNRRVDSLLLRMAGRRRFLRREQRSGGQSVLRGTRPALLLRRRSLRRRRRSHGIGWLLVSG